MSKYIITVAAVLSFIVIKVTFGTDINFTNDTQYHAQITVNYSACNPDVKIPVEPKRTVHIPAGWCLIQEIKALVYIPGRGQPASAVPYTSSGTGYRTFKLIQRPIGTFEVIRP